MSHLLICNLKHLQFLVNYLLQVEVILCLPVMHVLLDIALGSLQSSSQRIICHHMSREGNCYKISLQPSSFHVFLYTL